MSTQCQCTVKRFRVDSISRFAVRCRSVAADNPVGSRLERGTPMPEVKESYESEPQTTDEYQFKRTPDDRR